MFGDQDASLVHVVRFEKADRLQAALSPNGYKMHSKFLIWCVVIHWYLATSSPQLAASCQAAAQGLCVFVSCWDMSTTVATHRSYMQNITYIALSY